MNGSVKVRKGAWTKEEDILLKNCIQKYGEGNWHKVPLRAGLNRCRKSCRLRWLNYLRPNLKRGYFTKDEVDLILRLHKLLGNRWSLIAGRLPGRTANDVKNFWNTHIAKKKSAESSCSRGRSAQKAINENNILKPQPRTFSRLHHAPVWSSKENAKNKQSSSSSPPRNDGVEFPSTEDECIRWWGSLLELTENGEENPFSLSDPIFSTGLSGPRNNQDGLGSLSLDADVWGLENLN